MSAVYDNLTANLEVELEATSVAIQKWSEKKMEQSYVSQSNFQQQREECECTLLALKQNEQDLDLLKPSQEAMKLSQKQEIDQYLQLTESLKRQKRALEQQLLKYELEEERENVRCDNARVEHDAARDKMEKCINDLTQGIRLYMSLGLEFQKAEGECMKFIFTQIDPKEPSKQFYFLMLVDASDKFQLVDCKPQVDKALCSRHLGELNDDNNVGKFVVNMRMSFCKLN